jgi:hypothetical protein
LLIQDDFVDSDDEKDMTNDLEDLMLDDEGLNYSDDDSLSVCSSQYESDDSETVIEDTATHYNEKFSYPNKDEISKVIESLSGYKELLK